MYLDTEHFERMVEKFVSRNPRVSDAALTTLKDKVGISDSLPKNIKYLVGGGVHVAWDHAEMKIFSSGSWKWGMIRTFDKKVVELSNDYFPTEKKVFSSVFNNYNTKVRSDTLADKVIRAFYQTKDRLSNLPGTIHMYVQRALRGWSGYDAYAGIDWTMLPALGAAMIHIADQNFGYPPDYEGGDTAWFEDLRKHGNALINLTTDTHIFDRALPSSVFADPAREALVFVSKHYHDMWI